MKRLRKNSLDYLNLIADNYRFLLLFECQCPKLLPEPHGAFFTPTNEDDPSQNETHL